MTGFEITGASGADMELIRAWADEEGWNPGGTDRFAFAVADPEGFLVGRLDGEPVACISAVRYGAAFGFIGFYIARPAVRGQGYGIRMWHAGMERLQGRLVGLDGVVEQQDNYRKSGFRSAWNNVRHEGVPQGGADGDGLGVGADSGIEIVDAASVPFGQLASYDRRFFPESRDAFLSAWTGLPGRTALVAVRDGRIEGLGVIRPCSAAFRIGPLYAATPGVAAALLRRLAGHAPGGEVAVDVPDANPAATALLAGLGLAPTFEAARMYTGPAPELDLAGLYGVTSLELG
ncbi:MULTISPECIES: GNAT family N-acetyltransferase [unclassified Streptomyces]|uniref:GNAT family N-acetyltransferase n=1 Tax=unclassified Streptomyces TaxID=2593676 RepID=UPI001BE59BB3|nr:MULTISPECIES: GNAT family N-acetyltransferase [unclassified Streptomyces]MBT2407146.1 GNAT family N-acetyltransferase [Streptomyces sp. ISL-21]MBT2457791.1 GNAT family N-acetyltransferase [Streptomyces sp. ISL-86]MBT2612794.1 GNAT family N-acetyltransferase [Streptomyces sp. ISL-87]